MVDLIYSSQFPALSLQSQEVVTEINVRPHLLVRVEISGQYFPHRAAEPFVRIISDEGNTEMSWFARVSEDNRRLSGYFPIDLPGRGVVEYGYGNQVLGRLAMQFESEGVARLDRARLPQDVVVVSAAYLKSMR